MRFEKLRLSGFKSFVEPAELRIETGLTGVVGPNGCGKSNLLEAIRWVMGESSPKSLRGGGMEDVIFAGTAQRPARDFAEVVLSARGSFADNDDEARDRGLAADRARRGFGLPGQRPRRAPEGRRAGLRRCRDRRAQPGAGQPGSDRGGNRGQARRTPHDAGGSRRDRRAPCPPPRRRAEAARDRGQPAAAGGPTGRARRPDRHASSASACRRTLQALSDKIKLAEARLVFARWRDAAKAADAARSEASTAEAQVAAAQGLAAQAQAAQHAAAAALATRA